jgi:OOP family OmpA-OmpF porin
MKQLVSSLLILIAGSGTAWAEQGDLPRRTSGFFVGGGLGYSDVDLQSDQLKLSGGDFSYKVFAGYQFPKYAFMPFDTFFALEGGYTDLGQIDEDALGASFELDIDGFDVYFTGYLPITGSLDLVGKVGIYIWDAKIEGNSQPIDDDDGSDLALGLGLEYRSGKAYGARLTLESFDMLDGGWVATLAGTWQFK